MPSQLNNKGQMLKQDFARVLRDGGGNIVGIQGPGGEVFDPNPVVINWADLPDPSTVPPFTPAWVNPASMFQGIYQTDIPVVFITNASQTIWKPCYEQTVYSGLGSEAAPLLTGVTCAGGAETALIANSGDRPMLPAGIFYKGFRVKVRSLVKKTGAGTTAVKTLHRFGYNNTLSDGYITNVSTAAGQAGRDANIESELRIHTLGENGVARGVFSRDQASSLSTLEIGNDLVGSLDTTKDNYINISIENASATDTHDLIWFTVSILPR